MRTIEYLTDPVLSPFYAPGFVGALAIAVLCGALSAIVVLKRLAFVGQGVSHAAFGGVGIALVLGLGAPTGGGSLAVVILFCVAAALAMGRLGRGGRHDTAIGIVLVASMALGFLLQRIAAESAYERGLPAPPGLESVLFGSISGVGWSDTLTAWIACGLIVGLLFWFRREVVFWSFDEQGAEASGTPTGRVGALVMVLLALAVVITMRLAGVVLATALLVLPGATALALSSRLRPVFVIALVTSLVGVVGGLVISFETGEIPVGVGIVFTLCALYAGALVISRLAR